MKFRIRPSRLSILALCCALASSACSTWEDHSAPAPTTGHTIGAVRLTLADGSAVVLKDAVVRGDSIVGSPSETTVETAIALADVKKTELRRIDPASTFWTVFLGVGAVVAGWVYVVTHSGT